MPDQESAPANPSGGSDSPFRPPDAPVELPPEGPPRSDSFFDRLVGVFVSPGATFERIVRHPDWILPLLLLIVLSGVSGLVVFGKLDKDDMARLTRQKMVEQMEKAGRSMSDQQIDQIVEVQSKIAAVSGRVAPFVVVPIWILVASAFYYGLFRAFGAQAGWKQTFSVVTWGSMPAAAKALLVLPVAFFKDSISLVDSAAVLKANFAIFLEPSAENAWLYGLFVALDLFVIWIFVLRIVGLRRLPGVSKGLATALAIVSLIIMAGMTAWNVKNLVG